MQWFTFSTNRVSSSNRHHRHTKSELGAIATSQGIHFKRLGLKQLGLQSCLSCAFGWSLSLPVLILSDHCWVFNCHLSLESANPLSI